jgi:4-hydroxyphenylpyruvate dioxygenase-like putative hemolysin
VNVHARLCCLAHAGIEVSRHDPLWSLINLSLETISMMFEEIDHVTYAITVGSKEYITLMYSFVNFSTYFEISIKNQNLSVSNRVIKATQSCVVPFLLTLVVTAHIQVPFASFVVKVKPWSFLVERQLISSQNRD